MKPSKTDTAPKEDTARDDAEELFAAAESVMREAGVTEAVAVYEQAEAVYAQMATVPVAREYAAASTDALSVRG